MKRESRKSRTLNHVPMIPERDFSMQRAQNPQKTDFGFFRLLVLSKTCKPLIQKGRTFSQTANWQLQIPIPEVKTGRKRVLSRGEGKYFSSAESPCKPYFFRKNSSQIGHYAQNRFWTTKLDKMMKQKSHSLAIRSGTNPLKPIPNK